MPSQCALTMCTLELGSRILAGAVIRNTPEVWILAQKLWKLLCISKICKNYTRKRPDLSCLVSSLFKLVTLNLLHKFYMCTCCYIAFTCKLSPSLQPVLANNANSNNNWGLHLVFPTCNWKVVNVNSRLPIWDSKVFGICTMSFSRLGCLPSCNKKKLTLQDWRKCFAVHSHDVLLCLAQGLADMAIYGLGSIVLVQI